jgi:hypothetical protein
MKQNRSDGFRAGVARCGDAAPIEVGQFDAERNRIVLLVVPHQAGSDHPPPT